MFIWTSLYVSIEQLTQIISSVHQTQTFYVPFVCIHTPSFVCPDTSLYFSTILRDDIFTILVGMILNARTCVAIPPPPTLRRRLLCYIIQYYRNRTCKIQFVRVSKQFPPLQVSLSTCCSGTRLVTIGKLLQNLIWDDTRIIRLHGSIMSACLDAKITKIRTPLESDTV